MTLLLGLDAGSTVIKAVLFDEDGSALSVAGSRVRVDTPRPHWVERDSTAVVDAAFAAITAVLDGLPAGRSGSEIAAVGITGHGDGTYLVDAQGRPTRAGILSLDSRAQPLVDEWRAAGTQEQALPITGQPAFSGASASLLAWLHRYEPDTVATSRYALSCKDLLKLALTDQATTDLTDASCAFVDVATQDYADAAFALYDLPQARRLMAPIVPSTEVAGTITAYAARRTGLPADTPVVSGLHDVDACSIGTGGVGPRAMTLIAGTYNINEVITDQARTSHDWLCRSFVERGAWMAMAVSPTSATNLEWFSQHLSGVLAEGHTDPYAALSEEAAAVAGEALPLSDLAAVAAHLSISGAEVIALHTAEPLLIRCFGSPGGAPMMDGPAFSRPIPRLASPRPHVPAGAVAVAGRQAVVSASPAPGGWHVLGTTPLRMVVADREPLAPYLPGDSLRFFAIDAADFDSYAAVLA